MKIFLDVMYDDTKNARKIKSRDYNNEGKYPIIDQSSKNVISYTDEIDGLYKDVPVIIFGDHTRRFKLVEEPFFIGADGTKVLKLCSSVYDYKFIYYYLLHKKIPDTGYNRHFKWVKEIEFPEIPRSIQSDIVKKFEVLNDLISSKNKLLELLDILIKSRFVEVFGIFNVNTNNHNTIKFKDLIEQNNINEEDKVWLLNLDMIKSNTGEIIEKVYINKQNIPTSSIAFKKGTVLYSKLRPYLNKVVIADENGYGTSELIPLNSYKNGLTAEYLAYYLRQDSFVEYIKDKVTGAKMPRVAMDILRNIDIIQPNYISQEQFSSFVNHINKLKADVQKSIDKAQLLMDSLMQEYFG